MEIENQITAYVAAPACIYCGSTAEPRTKEHIIPLAIEGRVTVAKGSCVDCQSKIHGFEAHCLQRMFGVFRKRIGMKGRKRTRAIEATYKVERPGADGRAETVRIPIAEAPRWLMMPKVDWPAIWVPQQGEYTLTIWVMRDKRDFNQMVERFGHEGALEPIEINPSYFLRLIAKIAHGFAMVEEVASLDGFELLLPDYILNGTTPDRINHFVGNVERERPPTRRLHTVELGYVPRDGFLYLVAEVTLFAAMGAPTYTAVVARRPLRPEDIAHIAELSAGGAVQLMN